MQVKIRQVGGGVGVAGAGIGEIFFRVRAAGEHVVEVEDHVAAVGVFALGVGFEEVGEGGVVGLVAAGEEVVEDVFAEEAALFIVEEIEAGVEGGFVEMLAEDAGAEGVEGGDAGAFDECGLAAEPGALGWGVGFGGVVAQGEADTGAHFGGGGVGEGEDEEVFDTAFFGGGISRDEECAALCEDGGFAGACGGGDEEVAADVAHCGALLGGPGAVEVFCFLGHLGWVVSPSSAYACVRGRWVC